MRLNKIKNIEFSDKVMFDVVISFLDELNLDKKLLVQILF